MSTKKILALGTRASVNHLNVLKEFLGFYGFETSFFIEPAPFRAALQKEEDATHLLGAVFVSDVASDVIAGFSQEFPRLPHVSWSPEASVPTDWVKQVAGMFWRSAEIERSPTHAQFSTSEQIDAVCLWIDEDGVVCLTRFPLFIGSQVMTEESWLCELAAKAEQSEKGVASLCVSQSAAIQEFSPKPPALAQLDPAMQVYTHIARLAWNVGPDQSRGKVWERILKR